MPRADSFILFLMRYFEILGVVLKEIMLQDFRNPPQQFRTNILSAKNVIDIRPLARNLLRQTSNRHIPILHHFPYTASDVHKK